MALRTLYKRLVPRQVRGDIVWPLRNAIRKATSQQRVWPNYLIIGGQKCGSTSLEHYLLQHPQVVASFGPEPNFFDLRYDKGINYYRSRFPTTTEMQLRSRREGHPAQTGEGSPNYLAHPLAPQRVRELLPTVKLIVILRDPVDRAYSHFWHNVRHGYEEATQTFEDALAAEADRTHSELDKMRAEPFYKHYNYRHFAYQQRGIYHEQLAWWLDAFPREQIAVFSAEKMFATPQVVYDAVCRFLSLQPHALPAFDVFNRGLSYAPMAAATRARLNTFFAPHNATLTAQLGQSFDWGAT